MKIILFCQNPYALAINKPVSDAAIKRNYKVLWYIPDNVRVHLNFKVKHTNSLEELIKFEPDAIIVPGNEVPHYIRGVKGNWYKSVRLYKKLREEYFKDFKLGLLHGKIPIQEKEEIMKNFKENKINLLVSTTVIEVGIDVPNATIMVIEDAQRFGLSQLHQIRGRVGRGIYESYCILILGSKSQDALERIKILVEEEDGFAVSEKDLKLRGPGEFYGTRQHGLIELRIANIIYDSNIMEEARIEVFSYTQNKDNFKSKDFLVLKNELKNRFSLLDLSGIE